MSGATSSDDFFSIVSKKLDSGVVKSNDVLKSSNLTNKQSLAKGTALFQNMLISSGYKHIDHAYLAQIDQNGTLANSERIKDANFKRYDQVLMNGVAAANADQIVKKKKSKQSWKDLYDIDMNFDGQLDITDIIQVINVILNVGDFTDNQLIAADYNSDGITNILDVVQLVSYILGTNFSQSVQWLEENFPELNTKERLSKLDKSQYFSKTIDCVKLRAKYEKLLIEHETLKTRYRLLQKLDLDKQRIIKQLSENK